MKRNHIRFGLCLLVAFATASLVRAAQPSGNANNVQLNDTPSVVRQILTDKSKEGTLLRIVKAPAIYTARIDANGQKSEIRVTEEGKMLRVRSKQEAEALFEEEKRLAQAGKLNTVPLEGLPPAARRVITEGSKGASVDQIVKALASYSARIDKSGKKFEIKITEDGRILAETPVQDP